MALRRSVIACIPNNFVSETELNLFGLIGLAFGNWRSLHCDTSHLSLPWWLCYSHKCWHKNKTRIGQCNIIGWMVCMRKEKKKTAHHTGTHCPSTSRWCSTLAVYKMLGGLALQLARTAYRNLSLPCIVPAHPSLVSINLELNFLSV